MTQYHLIQARPAQSEAVPIKFISESVRLMLHRLAVGVAATVAIACQAQVSTPLPTVAVSPKPLIAMAPLPSGAALYHSDRLGLQFSYVADQFVVIENSIPAPDVTVLGVIQVWTAAHDQAIQAGAYEGGTEYPANVSVTVLPNPKRLSLTDWIQQTDWFVAPHDSTATTAASQPAIAFQSSGLYDQEHVALADPDGTAIVLVTLNKTGYRENDVPYQAVYQQIVASLAFDQ